jgi:hypothetical protein
MRNPMKLLMAGLGATLLAGCGGEGASPGNGAAEAPETRLQAVAVLQPGGTVLEDYVDWAVFPGDLPDGSDTPEFSDAGTSYDTPRLDVALSPGHYRVEADVGRYESAREVEIAEGETAQLDVPVEGALLAIDPPGDGGVSGQLVRPNGRTVGFGSSAGAHVLSVEPGTHELSLDRGMTRVSQTVEIAPGTLTVLEPDLSVGTLSGAFDFAGAEPDFGLEWTIRHWNSEEDEVGDRVGRELGADFEVRLPPGEYWVRGTASGLLRQTEVVRVSAGETTNHLMSVPYTELRPILLDSQGTEVTEGFYWWLLEADNLDEKPWEVRKPQESFLMAIPEDIKYVLAARDNDSGEFVALSDPLDLQAGEPLAIELTQE